MKNEHRSKAEHKCLFCDKDAISLEHIIPSRLGGRLKRTILCAAHNSLMNTNCDAPLIKQFEFLVHTLNVVPDTGRGEPGVAVTGKTKEGEVFVVTSQGDVQIPKAYIERNEAGRPRQIVSPTREKAEKILASLGIDTNAVDFEQKTIEPQALEYSLQFGGDAGMRGVLKIAYEFTRGYLEAAVDNANKDHITRTVLADPTATVDLVRWLPYENLPWKSMAFKYDHKVAVWDAQGECYCIVELFGILPFAIRLPGLKLHQPSLLVQGTRGEAPQISDLTSVPTWRWTDILEHAQPLMLATIEAKISGAIRYGDMIRLVPRALDAMSKVSNGFTEISPSFYDDVLQKLEREIGSMLSEERRIDLRELVAAVQKLC